MDFRIEDDKITVLPYPSIHRLLAAFFALFILIPQLFTLYLYAKGLDNRIINTPLLFFLVPWVFALFFSSTEITFDKLKRAVYRKTLLGTKKIFSFNEISHIEKVIMMLPQYKIYPPKDRFGSGVTLYMPLSWGFSSKQKMQEFEDIVLPAIKTIVQSNSSSEISHTSSSDNQKFVFFSIHPLGYQLRIPRLKSICFFIAFTMLTVLVLWHFLLRSSRPFSYMVFLPIFACLFNWMLYLLDLSRKIIFDTQERAVKVYYFGYLYRICPFNEFKIFNVTRKYVNGIYKSTALSMDFGKREISLYSLRNTAPIQNIINESKLIMQSQL